MNPYQTIMGTPSAPFGNAAGQSTMPMAGGPLGAFQNVIQRARNIAQSFQNPQDMVRNFFPDAPAEVSGDPDQLLNWLQQTGRVNPQMVQMARQMAGR